MIPTKRETNQGDPVGNRATVHETRISADLQVDRQDPVRCVGPRTLPPNRTLGIATQGHFQMQPPEFGEPQIILLRQNAHSFTKSHQLLQHEDRMQPTGTVRYRLRDGHLGVFHTSQKKQMAEDDVTLSARKDRSPEEVWHVAPPTISNTCGVEGGFPMEE